MTSIYLVEDEVYAMMALKQKIMDLQGEYVIVGAADNGAAALEQILDLCPDIVLTDIRMPDMDGLTLISKLQEKGCQSLPVIVSGYQDFEYAKQAIKFNVTEYILKPVNGEELAEILKRVRLNLDEEIKQRRNISSLQESYMGSLPILKELFLNDLVQRTTDVSGVVSKLREYGIDILDARKWLAAVIHIEHTEQAENRVLSQHQELIPISVRSLVEDHLKFYCRFAVFNSTEGITLIAAVDQDNTETGLVNLLNDICKESRRLLEVMITIGVGCSCDTLQEIGRSYQTAVDALGYRAIVGGGRTLCINDVEPISRGKLQLDAKGEAELTAAVKFGPREQIENILRELTARMEDAKVHAGQYQVYMLTIVSCLVRLMQQYDLNMEEMFDSEERYIDIMRGICRRETFADELIPVACRMNEVLNRERDNTTKKVILEAKAYIQENYADPELSVDMLCRHLHMSPAYFSTVFKKETGQTYINYLTEVRLRKAEELLKNTDDKTYKIAQKVGYQEQNYFSYVFKKRFGISPTKYRGTRVNE